MMDWGSKWLEKTRGCCTRLLWQFGIHCATHQIRVILISGVVITSLFYPALALYSSSQPNSVSILDALTSPHSVSGIHAHQDLIDLWTGHDGLRAIEDPVSLARCNIGPSVRVERILLQSLDYSVLNHQILLSALNLEENINAKLASSRSQPCIKGVDGKCLVLSPLAFWNYDKAELLADENVLDTLNLSRNITVSGIPVDARMTLAGRSSDEPHVSSEFDYAMFLALTYFFPESRCELGSDRSEWLEIVKSAAQSNAEVLVQTHAPTLFALEYDSAPSRWSAMSLFIYLAYASFFAYITWSMHKMNQVHSRVGVTFTAVVEVAVSTITSLSVCALVGFKVTMVPLELLPIVIVFVGAENMFNLVDAVTRTSVTLPVKVRVAEGLSHAGTSNTLKVVSYNAILGIISVFSSGAIRQFCVFAIVVLVAHWFLAHTFFITVLSIDIQRLELEELLRQNSTLTPVHHLQTQTSSLPQPHSKWLSVAFVIRSFFKGRAKKNLSLFLLLAITCALYYITLPAHPISDPVVPRGALSRNAVASNTVITENTNPAKHIWKILNPQEAPTFHIRIAMPSIVTLHSDDDAPLYGAEHKIHKRRFSKFILWLMKIMVLPIAATIFSLWMLMLYLLKNTELLEAQRNRPEADSTGEWEDSDALDKKVTFSTLPRAFNSDVEMIASSRDGSVVVSVGLQNEIFIWDAETNTTAEIDATSVLLQSASSSSASSTVTCVAVDEDGRYCAVGTGSGIVGLWALHKGGITSFPQMSLANSSAGAIDMQFPKSRRLGNTPPYSRPASPLVPDILVVSYESGVVARWTIQDLPSMSYITPSDGIPVSKNALLRASPDDQLIVAFFLEDGSLQLFDTDEQSTIIPHGLSIQTGDPVDTPTKANISRIQIDGCLRTVVVIASQAGVISLWDGMTGEFIRHLDDPYGKVTQLRLSPIPCEPCLHCGHLPPDSFSLTFSVNQNIWFFKGYFQGEHRRCSCNSLQPRKRPSFDSIGRRSRADSTASAVSSTTSRRMSSSFEAPSFPVSGHGVHSRRASEKESSRRASESLTLPPPLPVEDFDRYLSDYAKATAPCMIWQRMTIIQTADTTCDRGGWDDVQGHVFGIRRIPRPLASDVSNSVGTSSTSGLSLSTLDRWEFWAYNTTSMDLRSSTLSALLSKDNLHAIESYSTLSPSLSSRIPRLPFTRVSPFIISRTHSLAGFGNTLGVFRLLKS